MTYYNPYIYVDNNSIYSDNNIVSTVGLIIAVKHL